MSWFSKLFKKKSTSIDELGNRGGIDSMVESLTSQAESLLPEMEDKLGAESFEFRCLKNVVTKGHLFLSPDTSEELKGKYLASLTESIRKSGMSWH